MPFKDPEKAKEWSKKYYEKNKEKEKERMKEYYENNKEKRKEYLKENKEKIKEQQKEYNKEYHQTDKYKKSNRIRNWERQGIIFFDLEILHEIYINTTHCDFCNVELTIDKIMTLTTKCLDHDHSITDYDNVRNILCNKCNLRRID